METVMAKKNKKVSTGKKPFIVLSRRAVAGWLVVAFFICGWMFAIGVLVGRGTAPLQIDINQLQKKLAAAKEKLSQKQPGQTRYKTETVKDKTDLEFYEALQEKRQAPKRPKPGNLSVSGRKKDPTPIKKPPESNKVSMKRLTKSRNQVIRQSADTSTGTPTAPAVPQLKTAKSSVEPAAKHYTIQVAAFKAAADADKLVYELKRKGFSAYRALGKVSGKGLWYRVRLGKYTDKAEASKTMAKLKREGLKPMIVPE